MMPADVEHRVDAKSDSTIALDNIYGLVMVDLTPEQEANIEKQLKSIQRIAMRIAELPRMQRERAFRAARRSFEEAAANAGLDPEWGRKWAMLNVEGLRGLVLQIQR